MASALIFNKRMLGELKNNTLLSRVVCLVSNISSIHTCPVFYSEYENPFKKTFRILSDDIKLFRNNWTGGKTKQEVFPTFCDVVIIGGGVMGFSSAYWLQQRALEGLRIVVVEKDPSVKPYSTNKIEYLKSTTALSVGGIRQQFSLKENIELSLYSAEFLRNIDSHLGIQGQQPPDINFNPSGYLFLASEKSADVAIGNVRLQNSLGAKVELLGPEKLKEKFPWMNVDDVAVASHGLENEGWFDPWALLQSFKKKALDLGTIHVIGEVTKFGFEEEVLTVDNDGTPIKHGHPKKVFVTLPDGSEKCINFALCIIAAGAMSGHIANLAGIGSKGSIGSRRASLPVAPRKRYVHVVHCPEGPGFNTPFLIDYTGMYVRRDGINGHYICGMSPPEEEEPSVDNLDVEGNYFEEYIWPLLARRAPVFEKCKMKNCWAGFYDMNVFDENAFIGPHPGYRNLYLVTGFSGHGIQQSPAVGRAVMEMIIDGKFKTIDLTRFGYDRYLENNPLWESNIV